MASRRSRGDGGLYWEESRQRWVGRYTVGYTPAGKRIVKKVTDKTKTGAKNKLRELVRDHEDGIANGKHNYTVEQTVRDWLDYGGNGVSAKTIETRRILAETHVISSLGARRLRELSAEDVDRWLAEKARTLSTSTLGRVKSILRRAIARAQARDKVKRNVVLLCETPVGQHGRPSKALTLPQAEALLTAAEQSPLRAYIVLSLLIGARTEELRPLMWSHVDLEGNQEAKPPIPAHIVVWRSVREHGDTKTPLSRRSLALPQRCVEELRLQRERQAIARAKAGLRWQENDLVFCTRYGTALGAGNIRRAFRRVADAAGLVGKDWTPRELRHSFVSLLSDDGVPIEKISRLVGHRGTRVTELVYRRQLRPVVDDGATAMDRILPAKGA